MHHGSNRANPSALCPFHFSSNLVRHQVLTMPEPLISWTVLCLSPFSVQKKSGGYALKVLATKIDCSICCTGHANKQCKKNFVQEMLHE
jgi:hypothetical protein